MLTIAAPQPCVEKTYLNELTLVERNDDEPMQIFL